MRVFKNWKKIVIDSRACEEISHQSVRKMRRDKSLPFSFMTQLHD